MLNKKVEKRLLGLVQMWQDNISRDKKDERRAAKAMCAKQLQQLVDALRSTNTGKIDASTIKEWYDAAHAEWCERYGDMFTHEDDTPVCEDYCHEYIAKRLKEVYGE
jgi:hypothetical protein